ILACKRPCARCRDPGVFCREERGRIDPERFCKVLDDGLYHRHLFDSRRQLLCADPEVFILHVSADKDLAAVDAAPDSALGNWYLAVHAKDDEEAPCHVLAEECTGGTADHKDRAFLHVLFHVDAAPVPDVVPDIDPAAPHGM